MTTQAGDEKKVAEEEQADRIVDAGAKRLFGTENGKERLRELSYDMHSTAKVVLEAAQEEIGEGDAGEEGAADSSRARVSKVNCALCTPPPPPSGRVCSLIRSGTPLTACRKLLTVLRPGKRTA